ncbi:oxidoreductase [Actinomadura vinacea]|uniref:Oxidoreductase n=1 Tax=Actinomadura vinacea TaxID=115336 RepID=A0ABN3JRU1_9ACTN
MRAAHLANAGGHALRADALTVTESMWCRDGFIAEGEVRLPSAQLGRLSFAGARLSNPQGHALTADGLTIKHDLDCRNGFTVDGETHLRGATIGGTLDLTRARLDAPGAVALGAARITVGHDMFCRYLTAEGNVRLPGARIGGRLDLNHARLTNASATTLSADRLTVDDGVMAEGLTAHGEVRLPNAHIGAVLVLAGTHLINPGGQALNADGLVVDGDVHPTDGFTAEGEIRLAGARIDGDLDLSDSTLTEPGRHALNLKGVRADALILLPRHRPDGSVDLTNTRVGIFDDDPTTWPASIQLRGFTYDSLGPRSDKADVAARLRWLARDPGGYAPQLYDQLAAAYRRAGDEQAARQVAVAKQWRRRATLNPAGKVANWLLYLTVGYGYRTWLAAIWLAGLLALGTWIFTGAHTHDLTRADPRGPGFNALGYTLDVLLPIADLGQQKAWRARDTAMYWSWAFIVAGWVLTTAVVAGLTGILKRD